MAILVALGGAALGNAIGIGANAGWIIGSIVGTLLFPQGQNTTVEGPRLGDLTVTSSAYGAPITNAWGTMRMAGNVIWSTGIEEVKNKKTVSGGKGGGPSQTSITYDYFATFALALAAGEAGDLLRIWADGKLIYDKTDTDSDELVKLDVKFRFYTGSETQEPDGLIEADKGVNNVPAHRGICYIVFDRLPLKDFGNRVPNITAEVTFNAQTQQNIQEIDLFTSGEGGDATSFVSDSLMPDYRRRRFYFVQSSSTPANNVLRQVNMRTMKETRQVVLSSDALGNELDFLVNVVVAPKSGYLVCASGSTNRRPIHLIDPTTLDILDTFGTETSDLNFGPNGFEVLATGKSSIISVFSLGSGTLEYVLCASGLSSVGVLRIDTGDIRYVWDTDNSPEMTVIDARIIGTCGGAELNGKGEGYILTGANYSSAKTDSLHLYKMTITGAATYDATYGGTWGIDVSDAVEITPGDLIPDATELFTVKGPIYDETDDTIMIQTRESGSSDIYMIKLNPTTGAVIWRSVIPAIRNEIAGFNQSRVRNGTYGEMSSDRGFALYTSTGEVYYNQTGWSTPHTTSGASFWDGNSNFVIGYANSTTIAKWRFFRGVGSGTTLASIVSDLCLDVGLTAGDIDVTDLASVTVPGYMLGRQMPARRAIEELAAVYYFDGVESDDKVVFTFRDGKSSVVTINQEDLAIMDDNGEYFQESRTQEVELPLRYTIIFMDKDNDYLQQAQSAKRILGPTGAMNSRNEAQVTIAAAISAETAKRAAEQALYSSWIERSSYKQMLPWEFIALDPSDVVTVTMDDGTSFRQRLVEVDIGIGFAMDVTGLSEDAAQYTSSVSADAGSGVPGQVFLTEDITKLILLNSPLLRDADDVGRTVSINYYFMGGYGASGWSAATLYKSSENTQFDEVGSVVTEMAWGTISNALGSPVSAFQTDEVNTITVFMEVGGDELESATQLEMLNGANAAAIIPAGGLTPEIIQFRDVTQNADGSYTLGGLLRGRRGTDRHMDNHLAGETFLLLNANAGGAVDLALTEVDTTRYYKGVTAGTLFEDADTETNASPGNDLKPWAPVHLDKTSGSWGGDVVLEWVRRTRIGAEDFKDGAGEAPLNEDSESYKIEILNGAGEVLRTDSTLTTESYTYSAANQATDFPGGFDDISDLLTNPGFELGTLSGWTFSDSAAVAIKSGSDGNISAAQAGTYWLSMEEATADGVTAYQDYDISGFAYPIDQGTFQLRWTAYVASSTADTDTGRVEIEWYDEAGTLIDTDASGEQDPSDAGAWTQVQVTATAPNNARTARLKLIGTRNTASTTDVSWDSCTLEWDEGTKGSLRFRVYQRSAQVGDGFASAIATVEV